MIDCLHEKVLQCNAFSGVFYSFLHTDCFGVIPKQLDAEIFDCIAADVQKTSSGKIIDINNDKLSSATNSHPPEGQLSGKNNDELASLKKG